MKSLDPTPPYPVADYASGGVSAVNQDESSSAQANLLAIGWRGRWLIVFCIVLGGGLAWAVLEWATPRFTSSSRIYVERSTPQLLDSGFGPSPSSNFLNTQAEIIRSTSVLTSALSKPEVQQLETIRKADNPLGMLRKQLIVSVGQKDDIINVSLDLVDGNDAATVVNSIVDAYITEYVDQRRTDVAEVIKILGAEKSRRDRERIEARQHLDEFRRQHVALGVQIGGGKVVSQRLATLASELNSTEIELLQAKARFDRVQHMFDAPSQQPFLLEMATANATHMSGANLETQVHLAEQALHTELAHWGEGYPKVKLLKANLDELKQRLTKQRANIVQGYLDGLEQEYELLKHKRNELQVAYDEQFKLTADLSSQALTLSGLEEDLTRAEAAVDVIDERIKEVNLSQEAVTETTVSVMEFAQPGYLTYPNRKKIMGGGVALGGLFGFGLAWLRNLLDHRLRSIDEISEVMHLPIVGAIPQMSGRKERTAVGRIVANQPRSIASEAVRTMRTALHFGMDGDEVRTIVVTSPSPGDGKSTVASNLAISLSQVAGRVLLIDADMRKPMQDAIFGVDANTGLTQVLTEGRPVNDVIIGSEFENLDILPVGSTPSNPVELLNNGYFMELLQKLKTQYDKIVIDSPPVMPVADARVIAAMGDCTLLVLRAEKCTKRLSVAARDELWRVRVRRLAVVVNGVPGRRSGYSYGYGDYGAYGTYESYGDIAYGYDDQGSPRRNGSTRARKTPPLPVMTE